MTKPEDAYAAPSGLATTDDSNPVLGFPLFVYWLESFDQGKNRDRLAQNALTVAYTKRQQAGLECSPNQKSKAS